MASIKRSSTHKSARDPLYRQIAAVLREEIKTRYVPDQSLPPQRELAQRFKASYMTVGNAIQQLVQEGLVTRTVGAGTFVRDQKGVSRGLVGILTSGKDPIYMSKMFGTMERVLREARFRPILYGGSLNLEEEKQAFEEMGRFQEAGVILYSQFANRLVDQITALRQSGIPIVTINRPSPGTDCSRTSHRMIGVLQAQYVIGQNRRRILYVSHGEATDELLPPYLDGFISTLVKNDTDIRPFRVAHIKNPSSPAHVAEREINEQVAEITRKSFSDPDNPPPDVIVVYGDRYLKSAVGVLQSFGKTPGQDVLLVGADNQNLTGFPYASVDEQLEEIGGHAAKMLLDRIQGTYTGPPRIHEVIPKLVIHE